MRPSDLSTDGSPGEDAEGVEASELESTRSSLASPGPGGTSRGVCLGFTPASIALAVADCSWRHSQPLLCTDGCTCGRELSVTPKSMSCMDVA
eukprot:1162153-Pelagomonas_calceolata.AAC.12